MAHEYIAGKSGSGKSVYLENHALKNEGGILFLDPHGDSAARVADDRKCIYWEPDTRIGFNPLKDTTQGHHLTAERVVSSFKAIWSESWGPRLEHILRNSALILTDNNQNLTDIPRLLTDKSYRTALYKRASFRDFWQGEYDRWDDRQRNEYTQSVLNKVGQLSANPLLSRILSTNTIDPARIIRKGQRLIVNLSKAQYGDEPSHLLGGLLLSAFMHAAFEVRQPFTIYADEFQNFATDSFATMLSESRKYGLSLVLAHQYLGQLPDSLRQAVFGNVQQFVVFRVGPEDAPLLAKEIDVAPASLLDLVPYEAWVKRGDRQLIKMPPPMPTLGRLEANRAYTSASHALPS